MINEPNGYNIHPLSVSYGGFTSVPVGVLHVVTLYNLSSQGKFYSGDTSGMLRVVVARSKMNNSSGGITIPPIAFRERMNGFHTQGEGVLTHYCLPQSFDR